MGLAVVPRNVQNSMVPLFLHRQRKSEIHERIEGDGDLKESQLLVEVPEIDKPSCILDRPECSCIDLEIGRQ